MDKLDHHQQQLYHQHEVLEPMYEYSVMTTNDSGDKNFLNNSNCYYNNNKNQHDSTLNNSTADSVNFNTNYHNNTDTRALSVAQDGMVNHNDYEQFNKSLSNDFNTLNTSLNLMTKSEPVNKNAGHHHHHHHQLSSNKTHTNPYGDNLLSSTLNQLDKEHLCHKSYFDNLPPEIEISVYGSETLPENSVLEAENTVNTSGADTDDAALHTGDRRVLRHTAKNRYF